MGCISPPTISTPSLVEPMHVPISTSIISKFYTDSNTVDNMVRLRASTITGARVPFYFITPYVMLSARFSSLRLPDYPLCTGTFLARLSELDKASKEFSIPTM